MRNAWTAVLVAWIALPPSCHRVGAPGQPGAVAWSEDLPNCGGAEDCMRLGNLYLAGEFLPESLAAAMMLYQRACQLGSAKACSMLGATYARGEEVPGGKERGLPLLKRDERGSGMGRDPGRAVELWESSGAGARAGSWASATRTAPASPPMRRRQMSCTRNPAPWEMGWVATAWASTSSGASGPPAT